MRRILAASITLALVSSLFPQPASNKRPRPICTVLKGPAVQKKVKPSYPASALRRGALGPVLLSLKIDKKGVPFDVKVLKGDPDLAEAALRAVKKWRFKPYKLNGEPIEV